MLTWLENNKQWVFDGIGVMVLGALVALIKRLFFRKRDGGGGAGGTAEVIGDGEARGGKGGNSGSFGSGGKGGNARVAGTGKAMGGDGGKG